MRMRSAIPVPGSPGRAATNRVRWHRATLVGAVLSAVAVAAVLVSSSTAHAATLFSDDFQDGNANGWTKSGGSWSVVTDSSLGGSQAYRQSGTGSDAKAQAGSAWGNQTVQARVKPAGFGNPSRFAGVLARGQTMTSYYYLALTGGGQVVLGERSSGTHATLASASTSVSIGTWYTLRLEAFGSQLRGFLNGQQVVSASDSTLATGRVGLATLFASATFDDVVVTDQPGPGQVPTTPTAPPDTAPPSSPPPSSPPPSSPPSSPPPPPPPGQADGFASVNALGQNGTTGGAGGQTVVVDTASEFLGAVAQPGPLVVQVQGIISLPGPMHDVTSDKTIVGVGSSSGFTGAGLNIGLPIDDDITSPPANAVHNVIVRNVRISQCPDDCINVQMFSHHIWLDHNDISQQTDGALDIKRGSDFVTVSWNHFHDSDKNMLVGHDDSNGAQDMGRLRVTYHHNWFNGSSQRNPRIRFGEPVHIYNNYYLHISGYGVASQMNAGVLVEGNYFDDVEKPTRNDVGGDPGRLVVRNNMLVNSEDPFVTNGSVQEPGQFYSYTLDNAASVPSIVPAGAGVGKI